MGLYEGIKDVAKTLQQADNIELYKKLLDLEAQALDMQSEIAMLQSENEDLKRDLNEKQDILYHRALKVDASTYEYPYITLKSDPEEIRYCAVCWGRDKKLIPLYDDMNCIVCMEHRK